LILFSRKLSMVKFCKKNWALNRIDQEINQNLRELTVKFWISFPTILILLNLKKSVVRDVNLYTTSGIYNGLNTGN
jgi:hypothetical protein